VKKFITALLLGAFLVTSMAATIGCGDSDKKVEKKEEKKTTEEKKTP